MACACKVAQQLTYLQKKYGTNQPQSKESDIRVRVKVWVVNLMTGFLGLLLSPIMLLSILFTKGKPINVAKVFGLKKNERKQQNI